jgi:hypothetical protein
VKRRDPNATIRIALDDVRCPRCNGHGRTRIVALSRYPTHALRAERRPDLSDFVDNVANPNPNAQQRLSLREIGNRISGLIPEIRNGVSGNQDTPMATFQMAVPSSITESIFMTRHEIHDA